MTNSMLLQRKLSQFVRSLTKVFVTLSGIILLIGCEGGTDLTNSMADKALREWNKSVLQIEGVHLMPETNSANVDFKIEKMTYKYHIPLIGKRERTYTGSASANFIRYTDGTWVLKTVTIPNREQPGGIDSWSLDIKTK